MIIIQHDDEPYGGITLNILAIALSSIALILVLARTYTRAFIIGSIWRDDMCIIFAMIASLGLTTAGCVGVKNGVGKHVEEVELWRLLKTVKSGYISQIFYLAGLGFVKASLLIFLLRIGVQRMRQIVIACFAFIVIFSLGAIFATSFTCLPPRIQWTIAPPGVKYKGWEEDQLAMVGMPQQPLVSKCINLKVFHFAVPSLNIITDLVIWLLPLKIIWEIQLPRRQKWGLMVVFSMGLFVIASSILRLFTISRMIHSTDPTWDSVGISIWSTVEVNIAIICASIPTVKPLLNKLIPSFLAPSFHTYGSRYYPNNPGNSTKLMPNLPVTADNRPHRSRSSRNPHSSKGAASKVYVLTSMKRTTADNASDEEAYVCSSTEQFRFDPHHKTENQIIGRCPSGPLPDAPTLNRANLDTAKRKCSVTDTFPGLGWLPGMIGSRGNSNKEHQGSLSPTGNGIRVQSSSSTTTTTEGMIRMGSSSLLNNDDNGMPHMCQALESDQHLVLKVPEEAIMKSTEFRIVEERLNVLKGA